MHEIPVPKTNSFPSITSLSKPQSYPTPSPTALLIQAHFTSRSRARSPPPPQHWTPTPCFFYGTLTDPELLQTLLSLPEPPLLRPGTISGFEVKMWGTYPALVSTTGFEEGEIGQEKETGRGRKRGLISGMLYQVQTEAQFQRLQRYETSAYTWCACDVVLDNGERIEGARTFRWAGEASGQLKEGAFDRERWQVHFKGSLLGKGDAG